MESQVVSEEDIDRAVEQYEKCRGLYKEVVREIKYTLRRELEATGVKIAAITGRAKKVDSFKEKIHRKAYNNPISEITDLGGVRVVCYYEPDLDAIRDIIEEKFEVSENVDKSGALGIDKMGYNGLHLLVCLGSSKHSGPRYDNITELTCEIQVRTVLQDAWAIISHHLTYKNEAAIPPRIRRDLNNVASLMEIAQGVFDSSKEKRAKYLEEIDEKSGETSDFLAQPVDHDTLRAYTNWKFPGAGVSPIWHDIFLADLDSERYDTLQRVDEVVERASVKVSKYAAQAPYTFRSGTDFITKSFGFEDEDFRKRHNFGAQSLAAFQAFDG